MFARIPYFESKTLAKQKQVIRRRKRNRILPGMPARMQNFLVKVQRVKVGVLLLFTLASRSGGRRSVCTKLLILAGAYAFRFKSRLVGLQDDIVCCIRVPNMEKVVVGCRKNISRSRLKSVHIILSVTAECALKLVKDTVIFIQVTKFCAQVFMDRNCFYGFILHGNIPNLQR